MWKLVSLGSYALHQPLCRGSKRGTTNLYPALFSRHVSALPPRWEGRCGSCKERRLSEQGDLCGSNRGTLATVMVRSLKTVFSITSSLMWTHPHTFVKSDHPRSAVKVDHKGIGTLALSFILGQYKEARAKTESRGSFVRKDKWRN